MKPFLELGQFIDPVLSIVAVALLVIGSVIYVYGRDWIRARFKRSMPINHRPPPPCVPIQGPLPANYPPMPLPIPPPPADDASGLADLGESIAAAARMYAEGHHESREERDAERERVAAEQNRAYEINLMAERLFVEHRCDPEQAYADAVRWVDSRVAVALAECREPGELPPPSPGIPPEAFGLRRCPVHAGVYPISGECPKCVGLRDPFAKRCVEHGTAYLAGEKCPKCTERNARMAREPIVATINESFHWRIDPEAEIPTARGGEDGCLVRFDGEAFEFEVPASYVYPPDLPVAVADALRAAWHAGEFLTTYGRDKPPPSAEGKINPSNATDGHRERPGRRPELDGLHRGPDIDRLLALAELLREFDAHQLLNLAAERDPELVSRIDARKANDHLRRAATSGRLEVVRPGKRGAAGYMPTYRVAVPAVLAAQPEESPKRVELPWRDEGIAKVGAEQATAARDEFFARPTPEPAQRRAQSRCLVHGVDLMSEDDLCYLCMGRATR